ncbi:CheR family methyltransferase [Actibacterium sp. MT2.3-13A]|uniref:CheR family methyltransferase n=1 Tax=Actibacterium sp. MT2.3-13A TaxID=2828332 RepID=UPI001BA4A667|nr:CheR family methyltransferase [Actibacterium sp. MT2.3-13A]
MARAGIGQEEFTDFLKWCLPRLGLRWTGFRKVRGTVRKRLVRRLEALGLADVAAYRARLERDPSEWSELDRICRIPISRFYRDRGVHDALAALVLPACAAAARRRGDGVVWVLSAGCASGEEPYTINLIWRLGLQARHPGVRLRIVALDIDEGMLRRADLACYAASSLRDMPGALRERGFSRTDGQYCLRDGYRRGVRFERGDLREGVPAGPFDLILCRNAAFTYFDPAVQQAAFSGLDAALRDGGFLVLGAHESLPAGACGYARLRPGLPVFRKTPVGRPARVTAAPGWRAGDRGRAPRPPGGSGGRCRNRGSGPRPPR